jgi:hypothetical protein
MEQKTSPKDVFLHLLAILTLYASAGSLVALLFQYINVLLPDPLEFNRYVLESAYSAIRFSISSLVVIFPLYLWAGWLLNKEFDREPQKRELRIRKWLIYFTLFAAALIIAGDLVTLINRFLEGELTLRFALKVLAVLLVAGSVFGYYLADLKNRYLTERKYFIYTVMVIVAAVVIAGFFIIGSPQKERLRRFDERRVNDLQFLQSEIINYWIKKEKLPENLDLLRDDIRGVQVPKDPESGADYGYEILGPENFKLCAVFVLPSFGTGDSKIPQPAYLGGGYYGEGNWDHQAGLVCFERKIDKEIYKPEKRAF